MASEIAKIIYQLSLPETSADSRRLNLRRFAHAAGWHPSEELLDYPKTSDFASSHLVVEFGLENTAVLSFLHGDRGTADLSGPERDSLLSLSYNNLVDWHLVPDMNGTTIFNNRTETPWLRYVSRHEEVNPWNAATFDRVRRIKMTGVRERLDDALIKTVEFWRLELRALLGKDAPPQDLSALFNLILFLRASEDHRRWQGREMAHPLWLTDTSSLTGALRDSFRALLDRPELPAYLERYLQRASSFNGVSAGFMQQLLRDFEVNRFLPRYRYDFSIISKHALSLIYERYVALFRDPAPSKTPGLFPEVPTEVTNKDLGAVYTPQYIARFFSRFIEYHRPKRTLATTKVIDPACGSGIFLRTYLESLLESFSSAQIHLPSSAFQNTTGIDKDQSAVDATVLSLALLHLIATDNLPEELDVRHDDSIQLLRDSALAAESYDVVITNPPFVPWDRLDDDSRSKLRAILGETSGRPDLFVGFTKLGQTLLKAGGLLLYVLPHAFLIADSSRPVRQELQSRFTIHMIVDLSAIKVFEAVSTYVVLLIAEKTAPHPNHEVTIVRCHDQVGRALAEALSDSLSDTSSYQIYKLPQKSLNNDRWQIIADANTELAQRLTSFPTLDSLLRVHEGMITGADDIFVIPTSHVPSAERSIWLPFLSDREMMRYGVPKRTSHSVLYPYSGKRMIDLPMLKAEFPETWDYIKRHTRALKGRKSVRATPGKWWAPVRPRSPSVMRAPKIVAPHLIATPRFSVDLAGQFAVSRCPIFIPREGPTDPDRLDYYCAVLNSSLALWQLSSISHVYARGYLMLEPKSLKQLRLPSFDQVDPILRRRIVNYAARAREAAGSDASNAATEGILDQAIAEAFGLNTEEKSLVGVLQ